MLINITITSTPTLNYSASSTTSLDTLTTGTTSKRLLRTKSSGDLTQYSRGSTCRTHGTRETTRSRTHISIAQCTHRCTWRCTNTWRL